MTSVPIATFRLLSVACRHCAPDAARVVTARHASQSVADAASSAVDSVAEIMLRELPM